MFFFPYTTFWLPSFRKFDWNIFTILGCLFPFLSYNVNILIKGYRTIVRKIPYNFMKILVGIMRKWGLRKQLESNYSHPSHTTLTTTCVNLCNRFLSAFSHLENQNGNCIQFTGLCENWVQMHEKSLVVITEQLSFILIQLHFTIKSILIHLW